MPGALWGSWLGGWVLSSERGTPVQGYRAHEKQQPHSTPEVGIDGE